MSRKKEPDLEEFREILVAKDDTPGWQPTPVIDLPKIDPATAKPRFQIFTSGILVRQTLLLDTATGRTWVFAVNEKRQVSQWEPLAAFP